MILFTLIPNKTSFGSIFLQLLSLIIIFLIIVFMAYYVTKTFANTKLNSMKNNNMKIIETISIGFNNLHILKINEDYYLISSSKEGIRYLTMLNKESISELPLQENLSNTNFKNYINKFIKTNDGGKNEKKEKK